MEKFKKLNEDLLNDEEHPELIDLMRSVANDLYDTVQRFKAIAKAKGVRYNVAAKMKDAIIKKIMKPENGSKKNEIMSPETVTSKGNALRSSQTSAQFIDDKNNSTSI